MVNTQPSVVTLKAAILAAFNVTTDGKAFDLIAVTSHRLWGRSPGRHIHPGAMLFYSTHVLLLWGYGDSCAPANPTITATW